MDVFASLKVWVDHPDAILSDLCRRLLNRDLFRAEMQKVPFDPGYVEKIRKAAEKRYGLTPEETHYFVTCDRVENKAYNPRHERIMIKEKSNTLLDISEASEQLNIAVLPTTVSKFVLCYPKELSV